jgi:hypothetical protein
MDIESAADRHYAAAKRATQKYYQTKHDLICEKRRERHAEWRKTHPPKKPGRPRKGIAEEVAGVGSPERV